MRKVLLLLPSLIVLLLSCSSQKKNASKNTPEKLPPPTVNVTDTLIITTSSTPFREKPDVDSKLLKEIASDVILKTFEMVGNYYKVVLNDTTGYVPMGFVKKYSPEQAKPYTPTTTPSTSSPGSSYKTSSKGCSAVQCSGMTQKRARCRNKTTNCSGRCYLH